MIWLRNYGLTIATLLSIGLLITAANVVPPPWWLIWPAWAMLAICIAIRVEKTPKDSPYYVASMFTGALALLGFYLLEGAVSALVLLMLEPSLEHLESFVTTKQFLALVALYFAFACAWYSVKLSEEQKKRDGFKWQYEEQFKEAREWKRLAEEARDSQEAGNFDCLVSDRVRREIEEYEKNKKQPHEMTRAQLLEENRYLAGDNKRLSELLEAEYRAQDD